MNGKHWKLIGRNTLQITHIVQNHLSLILFTILINILNFDYKYTIFINYFLYFLASRNLINIVNYTFLQFTIVI